MNNVLGFISLLLSVVALYLLSIPNISCYILFLISFVVQVIIFYRTKQWFLVFQMFIFFSFNLFVYIEWIKKGIG